MPRSNTRLLTGLILFVIGAAGFAYGLVTYNSAHESVAGKLNSVGNSIAKALNGGTPGSIFPNMTNAEQTALIFMVAGGVLAVIGLVTLVMRRR
jgi:hypothetical protein